MKYLEGVLHPWEKSRGIAPLTGLIWCTTSSDTFRMLKRDGEMARWRDGEMARWTGLTMDIDVAKSIDLDRRLKVWQLVQLRFGLPPVEAIPPVIC
jgi:hypothetical protein